MQSGDGEQVEVISLLRLANVLLRHWRWAVVPPLATALLTGTVSLLVPARYAARTSFLPEARFHSPNLGGGLTGLATGLRLDLPAEVGTVPRFHLDVITSRRLRDALLQARFPDPRAAAVDDSARLLDILDVVNGGARKRLEEGRKRLSELTFAWVDRETDVITIEVATRYPELSAAIANMYVSLLQRFHLETRRTKARERRTSILRWLKEAERELDVAEGALKRFLEGNRRFRDSPELVFEYERLRRQLNLKGEVVASLQRQYEETRIQEASDRPVITIIDRAVPPKEKTSPKRRLNVLLALVLGGIVGICGAFGREYFEVARKRQGAAYRDAASQLLATVARARSFVQGRTAGRGSRDR